MPEPSQTIAKKGMRKEPFPLGPLAPEFLTIKKKEKRIR